MDADNSRILYSVTAHVSDPDTAREYLGWLCEGHARSVVRAGALSYRIVSALEGAQPQVIRSEYVFANISQFNAYESGAAKALRAEGASRFPPARGISFERRVEMIVEG